MAFDRGVLTGRLALLWVFVRREVAEQFAGSVLGRVWAVAQPVFTVLMYWWVFGLVWAVRLPPDEGGAEQSFIVFLLSALLPWLAFQEALNRGAGAVLARGDVLRHAKFPAAVFPLARCLAAHLVFLPVLLVFFLSSGQEGVIGRLSLLPAWGAWFALQVVFASGLALLFAALAAYVRDLPPALGVGLPVLMFTAPVLFPLAKMPDSVRPWVWLNPFTPFAEGYHSLVLAGGAPEGLLWLYAAALALGAVLFGGWVFERLSAGFADVL